MQNEFKLKLSSVRSNANQVYNTATDICEIQKEANKELEFYINAIPEFFSYNNEAVKIKLMYKRLKELDYIRNRVIPCIDVDRAGHIYNEYFDGMVAFIKDYISNPPSDSRALDMLKNQIHTATQADPMFIDSLFGGKKNEISDTELTDAVKNIEYLVDFLDYLKRMNHTVNDVCNACKPIPCETALEVVKLIVNSTCNFSNKVVENIMKIYEDINNSLDNKTAVKPADNSFKLF